MVSNLNQEPLRLTRYLHYTSTLADNISVYRNYLPRYVDCYLETNSEEKTHGLINSYRQAIQDNKTLVVEISRYNS